MASLKKSWRGRENPGGPGGPEDGGEIQLSIGKHIFIAKLSRS
jgi:hypothetical protein